MKRHHMAAEVTMKKAMFWMLVAMAAAGVAQADRTVNETRPLAADGRVEVDNISGEINVIGWNGDGVEITGTLEDGVKKLDIMSSGSRLSIDVELEHNTKHNGSAYLTLKIPVGANVDVETVSADISVNGVEGEIDLESVSGGIEITGETGPLEASSVSGDVVATVTTGNAELESVSGDIVVRRATGRLETTVVSGNIEVEAGDLDSFHAETVSGSIFCAANPTEHARFSLETMSGRIEMVVTRDVDADFSIETYSGSIDNKFGPPPKRTDEYGPGKELRFTNGSGSARITIESFSGSVKLLTD
jgi:DUF4097 and DUF4098 domain-containing protein YvlB